MRLSKKFLSGILFLFLILFVSSYSGNSFSYNSDFSFSTGNFESNASYSRNFSLTSIVGNYSLNDFEGRFGILEETLSNGPPVIWIYSPQILNYSNENVLVNFTVIDAVDNISSVKYTLGEENVSLNDSVNLRRFDFNFSLVVSKGGCKTLTIFTNDSSGNFSSASKYFCILAESLEEDEDDSSGGAGSTGGAGLVLASDDFKIYSSNLSLNLSSQEARKVEIEIENLKNSSVLIKISSDSSYFEYLKEINLLARENRTFEILVKAPIEEGNYLSNISFISENTKKRLDFSFFVSPASLLSVNVNFTSNVFFFFSTIHPIIYLENLGTLDANTNLTYFIGDYFDPELIVSQQVYVPAGKKVVIDMQLKLPTDTSTGSKDFSVYIDYEGKTITTSAQFLVVGLVASSSALIVVLIVVSFVLKLLFSIIRRN